MKNSNASKGKQVAEDILSYIIDNNLSVDDKLPSEEEMTNMFNASRISVRDGLQGLKFLGLLESSTRGGTKIKSVDYSLLTRVLALQIAIGNFSFEQLLEARMAMELIVIEIVINKITPTQIEELRKIAKCYNEENLEDSLFSKNADIEFHQKLLEFSDNDILQALSRLLGRFFMSWGNENYSSKIAIAGSKDHFDLIDALETKNIDLAKGLIKKHLSKYEEF